MKLIGKKPSTNVYNCKKKKLHKRNQKNNKLRESSIAFRKKKQKEKQKKKKKELGWRKLKIQQTIAAETEAKVAEFNLVKEKKQYEVEQYKTKSKKVAADAQYYENAKLVSTGLTPQERAEWEYKTAVGVAGQLRDLRLPQTYIDVGKNW